MPASCKAAWKGDIKKLKKSLKKNDANEQDKDLRTPLHYASAQGHDEIISYITSNCLTNPNIRDNEGKSPFIKSCECNQFSSVQLLAEGTSYTEPIDLNVSDDSGNNPLMYSIFNENTDMASLLLNYGVDVKHCSRDGETPLIVAIKKNNLELVELLGAEGADINVTDSDGRTPLMSAVRANSVSIVKYLLSLFPETTLKDKHGWSAFDFAQVCADNTCLRLLEDHDRKCDNPEYNPEHDNITTINSQDEAVNHKNSSNDWTAPPEGDLSEDENSFMSSPIELNGAISPEIPMNKSVDDIEVDFYPVLTSDKSISEVDLSISAEKLIEPDKKPGSAVNKLLEAMGKDDDISEGQVEFGARVSSSPSPKSFSTDYNSLGQISNIKDDDSSLNLSSEDIGYIPTVPLSENNEGGGKEEIDVDVGLGISVELLHDVSSTSESSEKNSDRSNSRNDVGTGNIHKPKQLPATPRKSSSEGSTPKASPREAGYHMEDDESTLSSITEKTEPVLSPELGEIASPGFVSPLPENTLSDSISINSDIEISGYMSDSLIRSAESGRKSVSPKGDTPSDFRMTPLNDAQRNDESTESNNVAPIASGIFSNKQTPPKSPPSNQSSIADGVKSANLTKSNSFNKSESKVHFGCMLGDDGDSDDTSNEELEVFNKNAIDKSDKSKAADINDLSIVSQSKSSLTDRNILDSARSSPTRLRDSNPILVNEESISEGTISGTEYDDEAEKLLAKSSDLLLNYKEPPHKEGSMSIDVQIDDVRIPAALAPDVPTAALDSSFDSNLINPKSNAESCPLNESDALKEDSSSDESETGKVARKYLDAKKCRESSTESPVPKLASSSNSNYCSSMSPMEGEFVEQTSVPTSKHATPRVSFGNVPISFTEPERTSTPIKSKNGEDQERPSSSSRHQLSSSSDPVLSAKYVDIERRKSEAERELQEIRKMRRSQSPCSQSESYATDSRNIKSDLPRTGSQESINSMVSKDEMPLDASINAENAVKLDLHSNPNIPPAVRAETSINDCASALNEAVSLIQSNLDVNSSPIMKVLQDQVKETKQKLHRVSESKNKSEAIRKELEIEIEELRRKNEMISKSKTADEKSKMDLELTLRSLQMKYDHEVEERSNLEALYKTTKEGLKKLEVNQKGLIENNNSVGAANRQQTFEVQKIEQAKQQLEAEVSELKKLLEEEQKTRLIQEEMFNEQVNRSRDLSTDASKNIRQKQDLLQQLTEAEEVCRNAENRNKTLIADLNNIKIKYETELQNWIDCEANTKTKIHKLESIVEELSSKLEKDSSKLDNKESVIRELEEKLRSEISALTIAKHEFDLKENELKTSNKQVTDEVCKLKVECEKISTERNIKVKQLSDMENKLKQAEEVGTASANQQINALNQKIGEIDTQLKFKAEEVEERNRKLRNAQEEIRQLELRLEKEDEVQRMKQESFSADADHLADNLSMKDEKIKTLQIEVGDLEEKLLHSQNKVKDFEIELEETNKLILDKNGSMLSTVEREQVKDKYVSNLEEKLQRERASLNKTNHEFEMLKCKYEHLSDDNKSLELQIQQMSESLQIRDDSVNQVNDKLTETRTRLVKENDKSRDELKRKNETLQEHMSELRQNLVSAEAARDMAEIENNRLKQEVKQQASSMRVKEDMFKQQKSSLEAKTAEMGEEVKKMEKKLQDLYTERLHLKNELSNTKDRLETEMEVHKDAERKLDGLSLSNSTLNNDIIELKGNHDRELQNKNHYMELYKSEQEYTKQLKDELSEAKKNVSSLEALNETMKNTVQELKDSTREEKLGRTLASKELDETRQMLENEIKTRSHIGSRIMELEKESLELNNELHNEQKKSKKAIQCKKVSDANETALQENISDLHKDIGKPVSFNLLISLYYSSIMH